MVAAQSTRTRHPKAVTRATILAKAYELYLERKLIHGDERLSVVLDALGYTTGAGYQIWANQAAFREDLQVYIAENIAYASPETMAPEIVALHGQDLEFRQEVLAGGDLYAREFFGRENFYLSLRFFAMGDARPPEITEALILGYENVTADTVKLFEHVFDRHKVKVVAGMEVTDLVTATTALVEGYALRLRIQPEQVRLIEFEGEEHHPFSVAFLSLLEAFTEPV